MLLRTAAIALLVANGAYFAWAQGALAPIGLQPASAREPQRLEQQIKPEALRVAPVAPAATEPVAPAEALPSPAAAAGCWQAGPFDAAQADALRKALAAAAVPGDAWTLEGQGPASRWIVYMGRYADPDMLEKKRAELRALRVDMAPALQPSLAPGLSLGVFTTAESANEHLAQLTRRGVRTARVVPEPRENTTHRLLLPAADAALRDRVQALGPALSGRALSPC